MRRRRGGFTFVEILMSMMVIAILAGIVIPKAGSFVERAKAAAAVADVEVIRSALADYNVDSLSYPPSSATGLIPPGLAHYLPLNFSFVRGDYSLGYYNWTIYQTINGHPSTTTIIGITVQTDNASLGQYVMAQLSTLPKFQWGNNYTFITDGL